MNGKNMFLLAIIVGVPAYMTEKLMVSAQSFASLDLYLGTALILILEGLILAGLILGIVGLWKIRKERKQKKSSIIKEDKPVDVKQQTIFAMIPFLDIYAAYRIKKFWGLFLIIVSIGIVLVIISDMTLEYPMNYLVPIPIEIAITVFLIRVWSKKWNNKSESSVVSA